MKQNNSLSFIVAEDHKNVNEAFCGYLKKNFAHCTVESVFDGDELVAAASRKKYDVMFTDVSMPRMNGLIAIKQIRVNDKAAKIIVVSSFDNKENLYIAFRFGAKAFLTKGIELVNAAEAINCVLEGGFYGAGKEMSQLVLEQLTRESNQVFTDREIDILFLVGKGNSNEAIGILLFISKNTVGTHMTSIHLKTATRTKAELVSYCSRQGWN